MRVEQFEDLIAWQKTRVLANLVYKLTDAGTFARDFRLRDQIRSAVVSVSSNIAEGFERSGLREFHQFLSTAKASCAEVRSQCYVATDVGHVTKEEGERLRQQCLELGRIIGGLRRSVEDQLARRKAVSTQDSGLRTQD